MSTLKHLVSEKLNIPVRQQRLLFKGKALAGNGEETPREPPAKSGSGVQTELGQHCDGWGVGHLILEVLAEPSSARCHSNP